jgi:hypothetical protein
MSVSRRPAHIESAGSSPSGPGFVDQAHFVPVGHISRMRERCTAAVRAERAREPSGANSSAFMRPGGIGPARWQEMP